MSGQEREALEHIKRTQYVEMSPSFEEGFEAGYRAAFADLKPKIDALGEGFFGGLEQKAGGYDGAPLAAREEPQGGRIEEFRRVFAFLAETGHVVRSADGVETWIGGLREEELVNSYTHWKGSRE